MKLRFHSGTADVFIEDDHFLYVEVANGQLECREYRHQGDDAYLRSDTSRTSDDYLNGLKRVCDRKDVLDVLAMEAELDVTAHCGW